MSKINNVLDFLKKNKGRKFTAKEISDNISICDKSGIYSALARLRRGKYVKFSSAEKTFEYTHHGIGLKTAIYNQTRLLYVYWL